ncbi:MAG: hypothetical protein AAGI15_01020 [Pseudomonadota bacterium]
MSCTRWTRGLRPAWAAAFVTLILSACSDGGGAGRAPASGVMVLAGSVGDGPVVGAQLSFVDAAGTLIGQAESDDQARYRFEVPPGTQLPVRVVASGGLDLVSGRPLDFELQGLLGTDATGTDRTLNLTPQSTLTVAALECLGDAPTDARLRSLWEQLRAPIGMGLAETTLANPMADPIDTSNVAAVVLASEALAEALRRTALARQDDPAAPAIDAQIRALACDIAGDGVADGHGPGADVRTAAVFRSAAVAVQLEQVAGRLEVDQQDATGLMDAAIAQIMPEAAGDTVRGVEVTQSQREQVLEGLLLLQSQQGGDSEALLDLIDIAQAATPAQLGSRIDARLDARAQQTLAGTAVALARAQPKELADAAIAMARQRSGSAPYIALEAAQSQVEAGESVKLSWAVAAADRCRASGGWTGKRALEGSAELPVTDPDTSFVLTCFSSGGSNRAAVAVQLAQPEPGRKPEPEVPPLAGERPPIERIAGPPPTQRPTLPREPAPELPGAGNPVAGDPGQATPPGRDRTPPVLPERPAPEPQPPAPPAAEPVEVALQASPSTIAPGETVTLRWSSERAERCRAWGAWEGDRALAGATTVRGLTQSRNFSLRCYNGKQSEAAIVRVQVEPQGELVVAWNAPSENADGSPLATLRGYRLYYGIEPGRYHTEVAIDDGAATRVSLQVPHDTYYLALTAIDSNGVESEYSNEIRKTVR